MQPQTTQVANTGNQHPNVPATQIRIDLKDAEATTFDHSMSILTENERDAARELYQMFLVFNRVQRSVARYAPVADISRMPAVAPAGWHVSIPDQKRVRKFNLLREWLGPNLWTIALAYFESVQDRGSPVPSLNAIGEIVLTEDIRLVNGSPRLIMGAGLAITRALLWQAETFFALHDDMIIQHRAEQAAVAELEVRVQHLKAAKLALENKIAVRIGLTVLDQVGGK